MNGFYRRCGCYEGLWNRVPKQNNGLEGTNNVVKTYHILRSRLSFSYYSHNATNMTYLTVTYYIVCKHKFQYLICKFQNFINVSNLYFDFDQLNDVVGHVLLVSINIEYWKFICSNMIMTLSIVKASNTQMLIHWADLC